MRTSASQSIASTATLVARTSHSLIASPSRGSAPLDSSFSQTWKQAVGLNPPRALCPDCSVHAGGLVNRLQGIVEREGVRLLNGREVLEGRRPLRRGSLRAVDHEDAVQIPVIVAI